MHGTLRPDLHPLPEADMSRPGTTSAPSPARTSPGPRAPRGAPEDHGVRNPGIPLDLEWVRRIQVNRSAVERRAAQLGARRSVKKEWQAAWLLRAITLMDLTTLSGDDTATNVRRLCHKARTPVRRDLLEALGMEELPIRVAAVCVYHHWVETAVEALEGAGSRWRPCPPASPTGSPRCRRSWRRSGPRWRRGRGDRRGDHPAARPPGGLGGAVRRGPALCGRRAAPPT
jgi:hypothetical protein